MNPNDCGDPLTFAIREFLGGGYREMFMGDIFPTMIYNGCW